MSTPEQASSPPRPLIEVASVFLRLGATAFGGPLAHLALMREELVRRRGWVEERSFLDFLSLANLLPGPTSTEVAMLLGRARAGSAGLFVAGTCFLLPSALLVSALAALYQRFGLLPDARWVLGSVQPVVVALVATAVLPLARATLRGLGAWALFAAALGMALLGVHPLVVLLLAGLAGAGLRARPGETAMVLLPAGAVTVAPVAVGLLPLFLVFLKIGAVVLGSGYVLLAFLQADLVDRLHWLTSAQLLDAVAVGQVTPGPVFTSATFVGWLLRGPAGAAVATLGVFLPAFLGAWVSGPLLAKVRASERARGFLEGVNAGSLALMAQVTILLGRATLVDLPSVVLCALGLVLLLWARINGSWVVLGAAVVGVVRALLA